MLVIRCKPPGGLDLYVTWPLFMGLREQEVAFRIDGDPIQRQSWTVSDDGLATGVFGIGKSQRGLLERLAKGARLVVQATPYNQGSVEAVFDLGAIAPVIAAATSTCEPLP